MSENLTQGAAGPVGHFPAGHEPSRFGGNEIAAGLLCLAIAAIVLWQVSGLRIGSAMRMGPGFLPTGLGWLLAGFGLLLLLLGLRPGLHPRMEAWRLRPLLAIGAAILTFGLAIGSLGLALTIFVTVVIAGFATSELRPLEVILSGLILGIGAHLVFITGLGIAMPRWPSFL